MADPPAADFDSLVRDALLHMYDAAYIQTHPLANLLASGPAQPAALRGKHLLQLGLDAIESLHPPPGTPATSHAWRAYRLLELRYVEGLPAAEVAEQLGLGKSQYHRDHAAALTAVVSVLAERCQGRDGATDSSGAEAARQPIAMGEADRMVASRKMEPLDLVAILAGVRDLLGPLAAEQGLALSFAAAEGLPPVLGDRVLLRQVVLGLVNLAVEHCGEGQIELSVRRHGAFLAVTVAARVAPLSGASSPTGSRAGVEANVIARIVAALGGELSATTPGDGAVWQARVLLPIASRPAILVLDNDTAFIALVSRYLVGHGWEVLGATSVAEAEAVAGKCRPSAVLLDVMLPGQDGWDLLRALRSRPDTREIPVIVCSVLYEPHVARALGATGYLPKPITQSALLETLGNLPAKVDCAPGASDRQSPPPAPRVPRSESPLA